MARESRLSKGNRADGNVWTAQPGTCTSRFPLLAKLYETLSQSASHDYDQCYAATEPVERQMVGSLHQWVAVGRDAGAILEQGGKEERVELRQRFGAQFFGESP